MNYSFLWTFFFFSKKIRLSKILKDKKYNTFFKKTSIVLKIGILRIVKK